jgi:hypothetical protein
MEVTIYPIVHRIPIDEVLLKRMQNSRNFINIFRNLYFLSFRVSNTLAELYQFYGGGTLNKSSYDAG